METTQLRQEGSLPLPPLDDRYTCVHPAVLILNPNIIYDFC